MKETEKLLKSLRKTVKDAQRQLERSVAKLEDASESAVKLAKEGAGPLGKDLLKLADKVSGDIEETIPDITRDIKKIEKGLMKRAEKLVKRK
ncbi:MAG: hypothetical protein QXP70_03010 [Methanomassiliicoccales archaeon]